ncbi:hypothetical protein NIASO_06105 [Niabella soli DSM 19437]|uniref:Uncharacterized protein n=1 Tax=Niabella soli DSM 19437 TaxID=929713 RepID=W0F2U8_9BACT|nr:hypothetical protein NIASO_06105 [Niabella soli DSM 19437]
MVFFLIELRNRLHIFLLTLRPINKNRKNNAFFIGFVLT